MEAHVDETTIRRIERERISAILGHAESAGRERLAHELAFATDLAPDDAVAILVVAGRDTNDHPPHMTLEQWTKAGEDYAAQHAAAIAESERARGEDKTQAHYARRAAEVEAIRQRYDTGELPTPPPAPAPRNDAKPETSAEIFARRAGEAAAHRDRRH
jgi:hypothetical protein